MKTIFFIFALLMLVAPAKAQNELLGMYQGYTADSQLALDQPHRSHSELSGWISEVAADALIFIPMQNTQKLSALRPLFTDAGYKAYLDFLASMGFTDALQKQSLSLASIVKNEPTLIGQGASAGRYAWAFEMPMVMTSGNANKTAVVRIQFGRSAKGAAPHGLLIESWQEFKEPAQNSGQPATAP